MEHEGFSIVHVNSPCTTYNDTYEILKGSKAKGIEGIGWEIPNDHDSSSKSAARGVIEQGGVPLGVIYQDDSRPSLDQRLAGVRERVTARSAEALLNTFAV